MKGPFERKCQRSAVSQTSKRVLVAGAVVLTVATAQADEAVVKDPKHGPYSQQIASVGAWKVKPGYLSLDPADTSRLMEKMQNPGVENTWLFAPEGLQRWFSVI